jgi:hypothetical protein
LVATYDFVALPYDEGFNEAPTLRALLKRLLLNVRHDARITREMLEFVGVYVLDT